MLLPDSELTVFLELVIEELKRRKLKRELEQPLAGENMDAGQRNDVRKRDGKALKKDDRKERAARKQQELREKVVRLSLECKLKPRQIAKLVKLPNDKVSTILSNHTS